MDLVIKALIGLSALGFVLAVLGSALAGGDLLGTSPEAFSRASSNLALLAIALGFVGGQPGAG